MKKLIKILLSSVLLTTSSFAYADLNVLNLSYRTGPFATTGIPLMDGMLDYANMLNERDGGIGGQKYNMITINKILKDKPISKRFASAAPFQKNTSIAPETPIT